MAHRTHDDAAPTAGRRRHGWTFWPGVALAVTGLVLLGYVGWQFFGTNVVSQRRHQQIVEETQQTWSREPATTVAPVSSEPRAAAALIRIPKFGRNYVVPVQRGVSDRVLEEGFGHFTGSAPPGSVGNFAVAAHRVTHGEPLRDMPSLRPGDEVVVETRSRVFTYRLDTDPNKLTVDFAGVWVLSPLPRNPLGGVQPAQRPGQRLLTLTTCSELFHTDNRMVAFGHLVDSAPR
jgi:sortase A